MGMVKDFDGIGVHQAGWFGDHGHDFIRQACKNMTTSPISSGIEQDRIITLFECSND